MARGTPARWLVGTAIALIVAFVGSSILVQANTQRVDVRVADIVGNASPSIAELAAARTEMRRLELGVARYLDTRLAGQPTSRSQFAEWRGKVAAHLAAYRQWPMFEGERPISNALDAAQQRVYDDIDRTLAAVDAGRITEARDVILHTLAADSDEVDRLIAKLIALNNENGAAAAREMAALRRRSMWLATLLDALSVLLGAALVLAAVRAARLYHRALDERRRLAEERASELDHFAERVAHDLKAPLASVVLGTTVASEYPSETQRALEKIQRTSRLMSEMIDALLAVARVESPGTRTHATTVASVIDVLVDEVRPAATAVKATVCVEPFSPQVAVACGAGLLASVLSNLLQNAVKYIGEADGTRVITVRVAERGSLVRFEIEDTGPGLPPALADRVFERHVRGERSTGLGLGLATVKRLVENAGGRLGVQSRAGRGSCFWVELPRATEPERAAS